MSGLFAVLVALTIIAILTMPWLMYLLAPGFSAMPEKFDLAVLLTQITFPYLLCMSLVALLLGRAQYVRQVRRKLVRLDRPQSDARGRHLRRLRAWATTMSPAAASCRRSASSSLASCSSGSSSTGFSATTSTLKLRRPRMTEGMRRLIALGIPGVIAGGVTQLNIMIGTVIASQEPGAVSQLYYADRLYELPLAIVGIAIGVVLLPDVSRQLRAGNHDERSRQPEPLPRVRDAAHRAGSRRRSRSFRFRSSRCCSSAVHSPPPTQRRQRRCSRSSRSGSRPSS